MFGSLSKALDRHRQEEEDGMEAAIKRQIANDREKRFKRERQQIMTDLMVAMTEINKLDLTDEQVRLRAAESAYKNALVIHASVQDAFK